MADLLDPQHSNVGVKDPHAIPITLAILVLRFNDERVDLRSLHGLLPSQSRRILSRNSSPELRSPKDPGSGSWTP